MLFYLTKKPMLNTGNICGSNMMLQPIPVAITLIEIDRLLMTCTIILSVYLPVSRKNIFTSISTNPFDGISLVVGLTSNDEFFLRCIT